jgi:Spy/CpxP family protein refolding chaperone
MKKLIALTLFLVSGSLFAQGAGLPPGKWWRRPQVAQRLQLTADQQNRLDEVFRKSAPDLIDMKADVEKAMLELRNQLEQPQLNREMIQTAGARVNGARGRLFERELMMLVDMRGVLTQEQWSRVRDNIADREDRPPPPQGRRNQPPGGQPQRRPRP